MTQVHGHPHIDARVLDGARLTASKIDADPSLVAIGHENIERYCQQQRYLPRNQTEWLEILERPWPEVRAILLQPGDEGQRLRSGEQCADSGPGCPYSPPARRKTGSSSPRNRKNPCDHPSEQRPASSRESRNRRGTPPLSELPRTSD